MDRFRMLPNYQYHDNDTGILKTQYKKEMRDYQIYGNSIQDGTPSPDNPIEIQSVGEKTKNLFDINNMEYIHYGSANHYPKVENGLFISPGRTGISFYWMPVIKIKPLTTYTVSFEEISGVTNRGIFLYDDMNKTNPIGIYKNEFIGSKCIFTITTSDTSNYLAIAVSGDAFYTAIISNIQIEEGGIATEYEPFGKYKIPIEVSGKNLFNMKILGDLGFELQEDGSYFGNSYKIGSKTIWTNTEGLKGSFYLDGVMTSADGILGYSFRTFYTDGTWKWSPGVTDANKTVDYIELTYGRQKEMYLSNFIIAHTSVETPYEPYREPQTYNIFLDEPLRKCGDYADYIDFRNGKLIRQTKYYESVYDALTNKTSESRWGWNSIQTAYKRTWGYGALIPPYKAAPMLNRFLGCYGGVSYARKEHFQLSSENGYLYMALPYNYFEEFAGLEANTFPNLTLAERANLIDEYMIANNVDYLISLKTPIETAIELPKIQLNKGTNIIKVKTTTQPSQVNWQYYK